MVRFEIGPPASDVTMLLPAVSVSPDGRKVAFRAASARTGTPGLWIRSLDTQGARTLDVSFAGSIRSNLLFWSYDSRFLVFVNADKINKIDVTGGPPQPICDVPPDGVGGGVWTRDNQIVFGTSGGLRLVSVSGGVSIPLTTVDHSRGETFHGVSSMLPDGRHFLYTRFSSQDGNSGTYVGSLDAKPEAQSAKKLLDISDAVYAPSPGGSAYLLFVRAKPEAGARGGTLMAQPFDTGNLELAGEAVPLAEQVYAFAVSTAGVLVYQAGFVNGAPIVTPTWFDRHGNVSGSAAEPGRYLGGFTRFRPMPPGWQVDAPNLRPTISWLQYRIH